MFIFRGVSGIGLAGQIVEPEHDPIHILICRVKYINHSPDTLKIMKPDHNQFNLFI